jgi:3-hydroxyacyl-CoA dehydrogenase/enoyl-CoA hydratase/3-hydroxybutyryl-CoA epimerase
MKEKGMSEFSLQVGKDEIAVISWDVPEKSLNILTLNGLEELENIVENLLVERKVKGVIITSGKKDFAAGMDLNVLANLQKSTLSGDAEKIF